VRYAIAFAGCFLAVVFTTSLTPYVKVLGVTPDLLLIFVACWAMVRGRAEALVVVPMGGLLRDLMTSDPVGTSILALAPLVFLSSLRDLRPVESDFLPAVAVVAAATFAYAIVSMVVLTAVGDEVPWWTAMLRVALPAMAVNALFAVLVYAPMRWLTPRPRTESFGIGSAVQL
jgi:rod shape-determining protein MreD